MYPLKQTLEKRIIFYQGESNTGSPNGYSKKLHLVVKQWRKVLKDNVLPFYFVQLANNLEPTVQVDDRQWADLIEQQYQAKQLINNSTLVPTIDVGMANGKKSRHLLNPTSSLFLLKKGDIRQFVMLGETNQKDC